MTSWIDVEDLEPEDGEILFIAKDGVASERVGIAHSEDRLVILNKTTISFSDILYWIPIPRPPMKEEKEDLTYEVYTLRHEIVNHWIDKYRKVLDRRYINYTKKIFLALPCKERKSRTSEEILFHHYYDLKKMSEEKDKES